MTLTLPAIPPPDLQAMAAARARQAMLAKPPGSLGRLEELSIRLAGMSGNPRPSLARKAVIVMAADHGVAGEGVSAYPPEVTRQMVLNFLRGGAAINVLARLAGARVVVVNIGVRGALPLAEMRSEKTGGGLVGIDCPVAPGTASLARGPAMTQEEAERAVSSGLEIIEREIDKGLDLVAIGEMGIGNTTAAAAITSAVTGKSPGEVTGRGTGIDDAAFRKKVQTVETALSINRPERGNALDILRKVGGLEIAGLAGAILGAASRRVPVVLDGFIAGAAALIAAESVPAVKPFLIAAHRSAESGHRAALDHLGLSPLLDLGLRLGEGTGAALAFYLIEAAARLLDEMSTLAEANVSGRGG